MANSKAGGKPEVEPPRSPDAVRRYLVVAAEEVVGDELVEALRERVEDAAAEVRIVAPALADSAFKHAAGDVDAGIAAASERLDASRRLLSEQGIEASGAIGDADPLLAIEDALADFRADEILLLTRPRDEARWLEADMFDRARQKFSPPIVHVEIGRHAGGAEVLDTERAGSGVEAPAEREVRGVSRNFPRLSIRDLGGIAMAVVGSLALIVLAAQCEGSAVQGESFAAGCVARYLIAAGMALINLAHVVALVLFESVRYRGGWERFFSIFTIYGTPLAIVVSLLVH